MEKKDKPFNNIRQETKLNSRTSLNYRSKNNNRRVLLKSEQINV